MSDEGISEQCLRLVVLCALFLTDIYGVAQELRADTQNM